MNNKMINDSYIFREMFLASYMWSVLKLLISQEKMMLDRLRLTENIRDIYC